jgi:predicted nucleotidyltransferase
MEDNISKKTPESKESTKRFELPTEPKAKERLNDFREKIKEFQKIYPEILGATVFGSMIRGEKAKGTSDIDAILYIDGEDQNVLKKLQDYKNSRERENVAEIYLNNFFNESKIKKSDKKYYHLAPIIVNKFLINESIDESLYEEAGYREWESNFENKNRKLISVPREKILKRIEESHPGDADPDIYPIFHAQVGKGIEKYRQMYLGKLFNLYKKGEKGKKSVEYIWENIYFKLLKSESTRDRQIDINIPKTFIEALKVYYPKLYIKILKNEIKDNYEKK